MLRLVCYVDFKYGLGIDDIFLLEYYFNAYYLAAFLIFYNYILSLLSVWVLLGIELGIKMYCYFLVFLGK